MGDAAPSYTRQEGRLRMTTLVPEAATASSSLVWSRTVSYPAEGDVLVEVRAINFDIALARLPRDVRALDEPDELPIGNSALGI